MNKNHLVTVALPIYNEAKNIEQTIYSILNQTYKNFQVLISDNGSTDETYNIIKEFEKKEPKIKVWRQTKNIGPFANFRFFLRFELLTSFLFIPASSSESLMRDIVA